MTLLTHTQIVNSKAEVPLTHTTTFQVPSIVIYYSYGKFDHFWYDVPSEDGDFPIAV